MTLRDYFCDKYQAEFNIADTWALKYTDMAWLNPISDAECWLGNLQMKDGQRIAKYLAEWNRLASLLSDWRDGILRHQFYSRLLSQIKDKITQIGKPST